MLELLLLISQIHTTTAIVTSDTLADSGLYEVTLENGNDTYCFAEDSLEVGDIVNVIYKDKGTEELYDDVVLGIKKVEVTEL